MQYGLKNYNSLKVVCDCILIQKMTENDLRLSHGLYIPTVKKQENNKIGVGKIIGIGNRAKQATNLSENDYVLYDYYSVFNDSSKNVITKSQNIIMKLSEEQAKAFLKGQL